MIYPSVNANVVEGPPQDLALYADMLLAGRFEMDRPPDAEHLPDGHGELAVGNAAKRVDKRRLLPRCRRAIRRVE